MMAGQPITMMRKVDALYEAAAGLAEKIEAVTPERYREDPKAQGEIAGQWREVNEQAIRLQGCLYNLGMLVQAKVKKKGLLRGDPPRKTRLIDAAELEPHTTGDAASTAATNPSSAVLLHA